MEDSNKKIPDHPVSEKQAIHWLQRLKEESWEAELLVSAIATYGSFQLFGVVDWATNQFIDFLPVNQYLFGYYIVISGLLAVGVLVSMFVIHFFLRAFWVGLVGLNSVFPEYGLEDSAYSKIYTEKILSILPRQQDTIDKVDELCSVIFSVAFTFLMIYAYMAISLSIYLVVYNLLLDYVPSEILLIPMYFLLALLLFQTLLGIVAQLKRFKNNLAIQTLAFKTVKFGSLMLYGPLYKNLLQITMTFGSNFKKKKALVGLILAFFLCGVIVSVFMITNSNISYLIRERTFHTDTQYPDFYEDQNEHNDLLLVPEIEADVVQSDFVKVFIPILRSEKNYQEEICDSFQEDENLSQKEGRIAEVAYRIDCYQKYHQIVLNGETIETDFARSYHPETDQLGVICYLEAKNFASGKNTLEVKKDLERDRTTHWKIPFRYYPKK
ncbi:MAG: hypothetical protein WA913_02200 [Pricia sp.]